MSLEKISIIFFGALAAYLLGAIPFGFLIARAKGIDIRTVGSNNIGATNVFRCVGKGWGIFTFVLDVAKGAVSSGLFPLIVFTICDFKLGEHALLKSVLQMTYGCLAIAGHNWPIYLGFRGGKGVATSAGMLIGLTPLGCGIALLTWIVSMVAFRYVSLASIIAAITLGVVAWIFYYKPEPGIWFPITLDILALIVIWRHRSNIKRLIAGTEGRLSFKKGKNLGK
jgi:glycerol-3-phosphate acyltransferase PlsY